MATPTNLPTPAVAGQVLTAAYVNDLAGAFRVLQVVQGITSTEVSTSGTTNIDTGLSATITPQSTSSKILVFVSQNNCAKSSGNSQNSIFVRLLRGATAIHDVCIFGLYTDTALQNRGSFSSVYLDSPNTTSPVIYKTQFRNGAAAAAVSVQTGAAPSTLILMEISA